MNARKKHEVTAVILHRIGTGRVASRDIVDLYIPRIGEEYVEKTACSWARVMIFKLKERGLVRQVRVERPPHIPKRGPYSEWELTPDGLEMLR